MSATVKLSSKPPGDPEINGLDAYREHLFDQEKIVCALVWAVPTKVTEDLATGERVPTVELRHIEPIGTPNQAPQDVQTLAAQLYERRTGRNPLPFEELMSPPGDIDEIEPDDDDEDDLL